VELATAEYPKDFELVKAKLFIDSHHSKDICLEKQFVVSALE
jgi:hypothetical protein